MQSMERTKAHTCSDDTEVFEVPKQVLGSKKQMGKSRHLERRGLTQQVCNIKHALSTYRYLDRIWHLL